MQRRRIRWRLTRSSRQPCCCCAWNWRGLSCSSGICPHEGSCLPGHGDLRDPAIDSVELHKLFDGVMKPLARLGVRENIEGQLKRIQFRFADQDAVSPLTMSNLDSPVFA